MTLGKVERLATCLKRKRPSYQRVLFFGLVLVGSASWAQADSGMADSEYSFYAWPKWQKGLEFGARAFGRFGKGDNVNTPPGDWMLNASYHVWNNHLLEVHAGLGFGVNNGTFIYGVGSRLNLLEFIEDPTREMMVRGLQRGLLSNTIRNLMIMIGVEVMHLNYHPPDPSSGLTYTPSEWKIVPTAGAQWYFHVEQNWAGRFYLETSVGYTTVSGSNYFMPLICFGAELL